MNWDIILHQSVLFAVFGALAMQLLALIELKNVPIKNRPELKDVFYWLPFLIIPVIGGGLALAYIYPDETLKPLLAINVGVSAPLIFRSMASINPFGNTGIDPGEGA